MFSSQSRCKWLRVILLADHFLPNCGCSMLHTLILGSGPCKAVLLAFLGVSQVLGRIMQVSLLQKLPTCLTCCARWRQDMAARVTAAEAAQLAAQRELHEMKIHVGAQLEAAQLAERAHQSASGEVGAIINELESYGAGGSFYSQPACYAKGHQLFVILIHISCSLCSRTPASTCH